MTSDSALTRAVVERVRELLHELLRASAPSWLDLKLTLPQLRTLFITAHEKTSSVNQIARHLGIGQPTASHLIDRLARAGLVDRSEDPTDRRRAVVRLSPAGEKLIERLLGWEELLGGWLLRIPAKDMSHFKRGLDAVVEGIRGGRPPETTGKRRGTETRRRQHHDHDLHV